MPSEDVVPSTINGVSEAKKATPPTKRSRKLTDLGTKGFRDGKTMAKRKNEMAIMEADANVSRAHSDPQSVAAYRTTNPLLTAQLDTDKETIPKN